MGDINGKASEQLKWEKGALVQWADAVAATPTGSAEESLRRLHEQDQALDPDKCVHEFAEETNTSYGATAMALLTGAPESRCCPQMWRAA